MLTDQEWEAIDKTIPGFLVRTSADQLATFAAKVPKDQVIVEIGTFNGRSTASIAFGAKRGRGARIVAVDPQLFPGGSPDNVRRNLSKLGLLEQVLIHHTTSLEAEKNFCESIGMLFIDGDHKYSSVKADLAVWKRHLADNSILIMDDTAFWPGPARVARESVYRSDTFEEIQFYSGMTIATFTSRLSTESREKNFLALRRYQMERCKLWLTLLFTKPREFLRMHAVFLESGREWRLAPYIGFGLRILHNLLTGNLKGLRANAQVILRFLNIAR